VKLSLPFSFFFSLSIQLSFVMLHLPPKRKFEIKEINLTIWQAPFFIYFF